MQLHIVKSVVVDSGNNVLWHLVNEYSNELGPCQTIINDSLACLVGNDTAARVYHSDIPWTLRPEYQAYHIHAQG